MKKILIIMILAILTSSRAFAEEEVMLNFDDNFKRLELNDEAHLKRETYALDRIAINEIEDNAVKPSEIFENSTPLTPHSKFFTGLSQTARDIYNLQIENTDTPSALFKDKLTKHFEKGPIDNIHTWAVLQSNFDTTIPEEGNSSTKFNVATINVLFDASANEGKDNFRLLLDMSHQHTRPFLQHLVQDAFYETKRIPHHSVLIGHSRPGVGYEGAQSPYTLPFVNRAQISRNLANVRKTGVRVRGNYSLVDYDFGGYSSDTYFTEFMPGVEFDGWVNLKPLGKTDGKFGKLTTGGGIVAGSRNSVSYFVGGAGIRYSYKKLWAQAEYAVSDGSNGGSGLTDKRREGWYVTLGYHITKKLEVLARYDEFNPDKTKHGNQQREYTAGINYYIKGQALKLILNYVYCQNEAKPNSHRILIGTQIAL